MLVVTFFVMSGSVATRWTRTTVPLAGGCRESTRQLNVTRPCTCVPGEGGVCVILGGGV